jgi:hypothetical protein
MSEATDIPDRVSRLEHEMAEVRFLATKAEHDASDCVGILRGHTGVLNAIRADQVEQGSKIVKLDARLNRVETEVRDGFARMNGEFAGVRESFARVDGELAEVRGEMRGGFARVDAEFADVRESFARVDGELAEVRGEMREGFARVDGEFADVRGEMRAGFARVDTEARKNYSLLAEGQQRITDLLTRHIGDCSGED